MHTETSALELPDHFAIPFPRQPSHAGHSMLAHTSTSSAESLPDHFSADPPESAGPSDPSAATIAEKLTAIESAAWIHVLDDADRLPDVFGMAPADWITVLPAPDRAILATAWCHDVASHEALVAAVMQNGAESVQAEQARKIADKAGRLKAAAAQSVMRTARSVMFASLDPRLTEA